MVNKIVTSFATLYLLTLVSAMQVHACGVKPRTVESVLINETGRSLDDSPREIESCKAFRPTEVEIRQFFKRSYAVPAKLGAHDRYSPCYASGSVEFSDNTRGKWKIASSGSGALRWDTGDVVTLFYPDYQWHDPFSCMYASDNDTKC